VHRKLQQVYDTRRPCVSLRSSDFSTTTRRHQSIQRKTDEMSSNPVEEGASSKRPSLRQQSGRSSENQSDTSSSQSVPQTSDTGRRKRGRPRKNPLPDDETNKVPRESTRFIHVSLGEAGTDQETRKAIRSHAMFAVRRDQREQRRVLEQRSSSQADQVSAFLFNTPQEHSASQR
jgi:hypothetical protein